MAVLCRSVRIAAFGLLSAACSVTAPAPSTETFCIAKVESFSNPEAGARGDYSANVAFADLALMQNSVGYGAAAGRSDEITIADGVLHLARPDATGSYRERTGVPAGEGAYMVQLVSPNAWRAPVRLESIASIDALGAAIGGAAQAAGCAAETKLAYRIEARVIRAEWSLDTLPQRGDFTTMDQDAVIVGLYANVDQGRHFVTLGRNIHAHVVFPTLGVAGHLRAVEIAPGGVLMLQAP